MANIFERIMSKAGYVRKGQAPLPAFYRASAELNSYGGIPDSSVYASQADYYRKLSWINIAVSIVSFTAATAKYEVKKIVNDEPTGIVGHDFEKLLRRPNPEQSKFDFFQHIYGFLMLTGNAYIHLVRADENTPPAEMWIIPSGYIKPVLSKTMGVSHYEFDNGLKEPIKIPKWQILHIKKFNPNNMFVGLSPIEAINTVAYGDLKMQEYNTNFFSKQHAKIPGALGFKDNIDNQTWDRIKVEMQEQWGGTARYGPMLLRNVGTGLNWVEMGLTQAEMEFIRSRGMNRDEIFSVYAPGLLTMISPEATEATARIGKAAYTEYTLWPMLTMLAEKFTNNLLPSYGADLLFEYEDIRVTDSLIEIRKMREYSTTHTINEIRKEFYDDEPLDDPRGDMIPSEVSSFNTGGDYSFREREGGGDTDVGRDGRTAQELKAWKNFEIARLGKKNKRPFIFKDTPVSIQDIIKAELPRIKDEEDIDRVYDMITTLAGL